MDNFTQDIVQNTADGLFTLKQLYLVGCISGAPSAFMYW